MPLKRLLELLFPPQASVDALADMVVNRAKTSQILSTALGYNVDAVTDVAEGRDSYITLWLALEMARRQISIDQNLKMLRRALKVHAHVISTECHPDYANRIEYCLKLIDTMLDDSCEHEWVEVNNPINPALPKGCVCKKCGSIKPAGAELPIASNDPGANI